KSSRSFAASIVSASSTANSASNSTNFVTHNSPAAPICQLTSDEHDPLQPTSDSWQGPLPRGGYQGGRSEGSLYRVRRRNLLWADAQSDAVDGRQACLLSRGAGRRGV